MFERLYHHHVKQLAGFALKRHKKERALTRADIIREARNQEKVCEGAVHHYTGYDQTMVDLCREEAENYNLIAQTFEGAPEDQVVESIKRATEEAKQLGYV